MSARSLGSLEHRTVVCPHCWNEFHDDDAWFISRHPELRGDSVIANPDEFRRFGPHEVTVDRSGVVKDPNGLEMTDRACPRCHLQIPSEMLARRPYFVGIAGAPSAGKTYFLTSMLHTLGLQMSKAFKYNFFYCDSQDVRAFKEYDNALFRGSANSDTNLPKTQVETNTNIVNIDGMQVFLPKPFMFRLSPAHDHAKVIANERVPDASFVFYDNAGETFDPDQGQHRQAQNRTTQHLKESSGIMFVYDMLQDGHVRDRLSGVTDPQVSFAAKDCAQEAILSNVIAQIRTFRGLSDRERIDVPLAVCVQKFDAWKSLLPSWATIDDSSIEHIESHGISAFHVSEINRNSLFVRQLLEDVSPRFVSLAESTFSVVRYFPVSALGTSPKAANTASGQTPVSLTVRRGDIHPFRVADPLLWLLSRWKIVTPAYSKAQTGTAAAVVAATPDRITVQFEESKTRMTLDWEYCGTSTVDPATGSPAYIPKAERPKAAPASPNPQGNAGEPPRPPAKRKPLTLDNPEERPKKKGFWNA